MTWVENRSGVFKRINLSSVTTERVLLSCRYDGDRPHGHVLFSKVHLFREQKMQSQVIGISIHALLHKVERQVVSLPRASTVFINRFYVDRDFLFEKRDSVRV